MRRTYRIPTYDELGLFRLHVDHPTVWSNHRKSRHIEPLHDGRWCVGHKGKELILPDEETARLVLGLLTGVVGGAEKGEQ